MPCETGKLDNLTLCSIGQINEEMKEARDRWAKNMDDHSQYSVAVGVEKLVSFLIPASECIEYTCLAFFGTEDLKGIVYAGVSSIESITKKTVEPYVMQIMTGTSEALKEIMTNENASPFTVISQMMIFDQCLQKTNLFVKRNYLYNVIHMANVESVANWKRFTGRSSIVDSPIAEILSAFTQFMVESRYCHVLKVVRVLPNLADNLMQAKEFSKQIEGRLNHVLSRNGPVNNQLRQIHQEVNQEIADPPATIRTSEEMAEGGLGLITVLCRSVRGKIEDIAEKGPKYQQLIRMENYYFLQKTLAPRGLSLLNAFVSDCQEQFKKVCLRGRGDD